MKTKLHMASLLIVSCFTLSCTSCSKDDDNTTTTPTGTIDPGNDPNFTIESSNSEVSGTNRKVKVFGIDIYAAPQVEDSKLLHAANIMAQYLDNNEDGTVDNPEVVNKMVENKAFLFLWKTEADFPDSIPSGRLGQDLGNDETIPAWHTNGQTGRFDASLEEVLNIITHAGYAQAYPAVFGENAGTTLANAMDIARGGHFTSIPNPYPENAWYTYDDTTCDYNCQSTEYIYWALTSILGAQTNRLDEIGNEWRLNTRQKVQDTDTAIYALLTDPQYRFPTVLPDGNYRR